MFWFRKLKRPQVISLENCFIFLSVVLGVFFVLLILYVLPSVVSAYLQVLEIPTASSSSRRSR